MIRIKSARARDLSHNWNTGVLDKLSERTGVIADTLPNSYLMNYIGMTAAWSSSPADTSDALKTDPETANDFAGKAAVLRHAGGSPSIRMVGVNCAFCHTGNLGGSGVPLKIDGGQGNTSLYRNNSDLVVSTLALLIDYENQLQNFLVSFGYDENQAKSIAKAFKKKSLHDARLTTKIKLFLKQVGIIQNTPSYFLENETSNIAERFKELLRITYRIDPAEALGPELEHRMEYLAKFSAGYPKASYLNGHREKYHTEVAGFGRLDAFVEAGNRVFRKRSEWANTTAPVGLPSIWGIQNKAILHYTGNTNSVMVRNIGQAIGLGALILDSDSHSTVNIGNLNRLETLMYKIQPPRWADVFAEHPVNQVAATRGKLVFEAQCASCHTPQAKVGPHQDLNYYGMYNLLDLGTDPELAKNIALPIHSDATSQVSFANDFADAAHGIARTYFKDYQISEHTQRNWLYTDHKGPEWIRDTYSDLKTQTEGAANGYPSVPPQSGYVSRELAGIWATAPYLHNNSVPTLWDLLQPASRRPQIFAMGTLDYDHQKIGTLQRPENERPTVCNGDYKWDENTCFDTRRTGNSNTGHEYGVKLSDSQKMDLIEYLKILELSGS
jgi:mono/diheme cytochrome c family protein